MKTCTLGKRHTWTFSHNVIIQQQNGRSIRISKRGLYNCACGATNKGGAQ
jgi:hypothetical protein